MNLSNRINEWVNSPNVSNAKRTARNVFLILLTCILPALLIVLVATLPAFILEIIGGIALGTFLIWLFKENK